ncbi:uncharacterized protein [Palaemon carinicauda]|uniref:uncharacterized protein n=1 Tax=Palaemon carinicauda TaxID=392227 RepID=UPI0035B615DE
MEEDFDVVDYLLHCDASNNILTIQPDLPAYAYCSAAFQSHNVCTTSRLARALNANATNSDVTSSPSLALNGMSVERSTVPFSHAFTTHKESSTTGQQFPSSAVPGYGNSATGFSGSCKYSKTIPKKHQRSASDSSITISCKCKNDSHGPLGSNSVCMNGSKPQGVTKKVGQNKESDTTYNFSGNKISSGSRERKLVRSLSNKWESPSCDNKCNLSDHTPPPPPPSVKKLLRKFENASNTFIYDSSSEGSSNKGDGYDQSFKESSSKRSKVFKCFAKGSPESEECKSERISKVSNSEPKNYNHNYRPSLDRTKSEPSSLNGGNVNEHVPPKVVNHLKMQFETSSPKLKRASSFAKKDDIHGRTKECVQRYSSPKEKLGKRPIMKGKDRVAQSDCNESSGIECVEDNTLKESRSKSPNYEFVSAWKKQERETERDPGTPSVRHLAKRFEEVVSGKAKKTLKRTVTFPQTYTEGEKESSVKTPITEVLSSNVPQSKIKENKMATLVGCLSGQFDTPYPDLHRKNKKVYERSEDSEYVTFKRIVQVIDIPLYECSKETQSHNEILDMSQEEHPNFSSSSLCKSRQTMVENEFDREFDNIIQMNDIAKDCKTAVTFREERYSECSVSQKLETKENEVTENTLNENSNTDAGNERNKEDYRSPITEKLKAAKVLNKSLVGEIDITKGNNMLRKDAAEEKLHSKVNIVQNYEQLFNNIDHTSEEKVPNVHRNITEGDREFDVTLLIDKFKSCKKEYLNSSSYHSDEEWASPPKRNKEYTPMKSPGYFESLSPSCDNHLGSLDICNGKFQLNRKNSDVALLIDKFTKLNKRKISSSSSQSSRGETEDFSPEQTHSTSTPMAKGKNFQGKVRYLYSDELRFFDEDEDDAQPFVRTQSLRLHRTQSVYVGESFKRSQSLRQKKNNAESKASSQSECQELKKTSFLSPRTPTHSPKTPAHSSQTPTQSSRVSNKPFRYLYPEELEYFNKNFNNIYSVKEIRNSNGSPGNKFDTDTKSDGDNSLGNSESESDCCILRECINETTFNENQYYEQFTNISGFIHYLDKTEDQANIEKDCLNLSIIDSEISEMIKVPVKKVDLLEINSDLEENLTDQDLSFMTVCLDSFDSNESLRESGKQEHNHGFSKDSLTMSNCSEMYFDCFTEAISSRVSSIEHIAPTISSNESGRQTGSLSNSLSYPIEKSLDSKSAHACNVTYIQQKDSELKAEDSNAKSPFPNKELITTDESGEFMKQLKVQEFANYVSDIWETKSQNLIPNSSRVDLDQPTYGGHEQAEMYFDSKDVDFEKGFSSSHKKYLSQGRRQSDVTHLVKKFDILTNRRHSLSLEPIREKWSSVQGYSHNLHNDSSNNRINKHFMENYPDARRVERRDSNVASLIEKFRNMEKGIFSSSNIRPKETDDYFQNSFAYDTKTNFPSTMKSVNEKCPKANTNVSKKTEFSSDNLEIPDNFRTERRDSDVALLIQKFSQLNIQRRSSYSSQSSSMESLEMLPENNDEIESTRKAKHASGTIKSAMRGCRELYPNESKYFLNDVACIYPLPCINECTFTLQREAESISLSAHKHKERTFSNTLTLPEWVPSLNETSLGNARGNKIYLSPNNILSPASKLLADTSDISNVDSKFERLYDLDQDYE